MKKSVLLLILLALLPSFASAAIARDNSGHIQYSGSVTSISAAYTNTAGNILVAFCGFNGETSPTITATYNSVSMVAAGGVAFVGTGSTRGFQGFVLVNPATGSNTFKCSSTISGGMEAFYASYTGAATVGQPDNTNQAPGSTGTSISSNITVNTANSWVVAVGLADNTSGEGTGSGVLTSLTYDTVTGTTLGDSNGALTAGSHAYGFTFPGSSGNTGLGAISIAPPAAASAPLLQTIYGWW